ncbi:MAG: B12-binding domain-containing radical SAM protein [Desulfobaccales bacterium]
MRVLCISLNRSRLIMLPFPLGPAALVAALGPEHPFRVIDFMFEPDPRAKVLAVLEDFRPELIALSMRNIDNQNSCFPEIFFPEAREFCHWLRNHTRAPIVLGGSGFSIFSQELMNYLGADMGIVGEGDLSFRALLESYPGGDWTTIPGLVWQDQGSWRENPAQAVALDALPDPALEFFTPLSYHETAGTAGLPGVITVQSRRGCPRRCRYCSTARLEGTRVRTRPVEKVAAFMAACYHRWGLNRFYFVDNIFNHPREYARSLCRAIKDLHLPLEWSCLINPAYPDAELFHLIREAGCDKVQVGNESGSDLVLTSLGKGFTRRQVEETLQLLMQAGLNYGCFLLMGGPGETPDTVQESVELLERYNPILVNLTVGIRIYPHTALCGQALAEGVITAGDNLLWPHFYLSAAVAGWIWDYLRDLTSRHPNWIF